MEMLFVQSSFAFLARIWESKMQYFLAVGRHVWKCGPKRGSTRNLTKLWEVNKNQAESEDSNDLVLDSDGQIKWFIFELPCSSSSEEKEGEEQELVIESDNIEGDQVCCIQLLQCWKSKEVV